ncbi:class II glutamine amidotransferase [Amycolatopsis sp. lyj-23]|uniref:class II glutamine amidotransferase n=1 Tax=Amycolatopsis sp. lyj-23 TaxID=2789283 RepID=UPI00397A9FB2
MCLLTYLPAGTLPDTTALANGAAHNKDGHGYAIVDGDRIITGRGMDAAAVIDEFAALRGRHPDQPALFHSRFATHGPVTDDNIHPFPIGGDSRTVLAHNGILSQKEHPSRSDPRSDTRIAADDILSAEPFLTLDRPETRRRIESWLGEYNKLAILTVNPRYPDHGYLFNEHAGYWDDQVWYSNHGYLDPHPAQTAWSDLEDGCHYCGVDDAIDVDTGLCLACGACPFCAVDNQPCPSWCLRLLGGVCCFGCGEDLDDCVCVAAPALNR